MLRKSDYQIDREDTREMDLNKIENLCLLKIKNLISFCRFLISKRKRDLLDRVTRNSKMTFLRKKAAFQWTKKLHRQKEPKNQAVKEDLEIEGKTKQLEKLSRER